MDEAKITLDAETFKALASETRVKILKTLEKRRHTQSELSVVLKMSVPTIKDHLKAMEKAGLVKRHEEGRKWIYYSLTERSKCILDPERKRLWIVLSFLLFSIAGTIFTITKYFVKPLGVFAAAMPPPKAGLMQAVADEAAESLVAPEMAEITRTATQEITKTPYAMIFFIAITIILLIMAIFYFRKSKLNKFSLVKSLNKK